MADFVHRPHPHIARRKPPRKTTEHHTGLNGKVAVLITGAVGTMWCAYLFTLLALISAPSALGSGDSLIIVAWIAQTFIQLVLLPIIIVGQNISSKAADERADATYKDAEAIFHEAQQIQDHLKAQDDRLESIIGKLEKEEQSWHRYGEPPA